MTFEEKTIDSKRIYEGRIINLIYKNPINYYLILAQLTVIINSKSRSCKQKTVKTAIQVYFFLYREARFFASFLPP